MKLLLVVSTILAVGGFACIKIDQLSPAEEVMWERRQPARYAYFGGALLLGVIGFIVAAIWWAVS